MMILGFAVHQLLFLYQPFFTMIMMEFVHIKFLMSFCLIGMVWFKKDRTTFRYALEKFDEGTRKKLMEL